MQLSLPRGPALPSPAATAALRDPRDRRKALPRFKALSAAGGLFAFVRASIAVLVCMAAPTLQAQGTLDKAIRIIVPSAAGGGVDVITRLFAQPFGAALGTTTFIENQAGANGNLGLANIARAAPDGQTLAMVSASMMTINPHLYANMPVDTLNGLTLISVVSTGPMAVVVNPALPVRSMAELIDYARRNPGALNCGSGGNGTLAHLTLELLKMKTGTNITHVPYKGSSPALADVVAGQIQMDVDVFATTVPYAQAGKLRVLAVTSARRSSVSPDVPTVAEAGLPGFSADAWVALVGPPGMSPALVARLQREAAAAATQPETRARLAALGSEAVGSTSAEFAALAKSDFAKWQEVVVATKMKLD